MAIVLYISLTLCTFFRRKRMAEAVASATAVETQTGRIIRLEHGCPNCGAAWQKPDPNPLNTIWFEEPGKEKAGLELCPNCVFWPRKIVKKRIITTLRGLKWPKPKLWAFEIGLGKFLQKKPPLYS